MALDELGMNLVAQESPAMAKLLASNSVQQVIVDLTFKENHNKDALHSSATEVDDSVGEEYVLSDCFMAPAVRPFEGPTTSAPTSTQDCRKKRRQGTSASATSDP